MKDRYHKKANVLGHVVLLDPVGAGCISDAGGQGGQCINGIDAWKGTSCNLFFISHQFAVMSK